MRWVLRLFLLVLGGAFVLGLLAVLGLYLLYGTIRWLLTGQKPQVAVVWQHYQGVRERFGAGMNSARADVVDVQAREVRDQPPSLSKPSED